MDPNELTTLSPSELDTIGEIMNISMGSSATALSTMLDKQVSITTPSLQQELFSNIDNSSLEPAILIKIKYVKGISGTNAIMFKRRDMQVIVNILMGNENPEELDEDFELDDMSMSAACEVMNQMMGSSSTAISEILDILVDISPPEAHLIKMREDIEGELFDLHEGEPIVSVSFELSIDGILDTTFASMLPLSLARDIVDQVNKDMQSDVPVSTTPPPAETPAAPAAPAPTPPPAAPAAAPAAAPPPAAPAAPPPMAPAAPAAPAAMDMAAMQQQMAAMAAMQQQMTAMQQTQPTAMGGVPMPEVKYPTYPGFNPGSAPASVPATANMKLLMNVSLDVSIVIGRTEQKVKDIVEFGQGTVLELDTQTGAPAEIVVNGKLLAYGDIIVVKDNFGIRITEIVESKEILDLLTQ